MTVDTSRPAVEALIAEHEALWARGSYINASLARQIERTLAALLDERDAQNGLINAQAHTLGAKHHDNAIKWRERAERAEVGYETMLESLHRVEAEHNKLTAELAQVKQCRDEYGHEIDVVNARWDKLDAVKAWATAEDKATEMSWSDYNCGRGDAAREVLAILADTDEGNGDE